jgi:N-acetylglutamate synthase-like GNAT family acetyltransferase
MKNEIEFRDGYSAEWIKQILDIHNKTELKRSESKKDIINEAFNASFAVVTAWKDNQLIACGRMISDGQMYSAIFDVVVDPDFQKQGLGKKIMAKLSEKVPGTCIYLTSTFGNEPFYQKLGFRKHKTALALYPKNMANSPYLEQSDSEKE